MRRSTTFHPIAAVAAVAAALALSACDRVDPPRSANAPIKSWTGTPSQWVGCEAGVKYTGGGRVDPVNVGKVTFGFEVDGSDVCDGGTARGNLQVVYHETQTLVHAITVDHFASFTDPQRGDCGEFSGTARVKHVREGGDWHEHQYYTEVCDNGEPGHGVDTFLLTLDGERGQHENIWAEPLTGGNIQAHKK